MAAHSVPVGGPSGRTLGIKEGPTSQLVLNEVVIKPKILLFSIIKSKITTFDILICWLLLGFDLAASLFIQLLKTSYSCQHAFSAQEA